MLAWLPRHWHAAAATLLQHCNGMTPHIMPIFPVLTVRQFLRSPGDTVWSDVKRAPTLISYANTTRTVAYAYAVSQETQYFTRFLSPGKLDISVRLELMCMFERVFSCLYLLKRDNHSPSSNCARSPIEDLWLEFLIVLIGVGGTC